MGAEVWRVGSCFHGAVSTAKRQRQYRQKWSDDHEHRNKNSHTLVHGSLSLKNLHPLMCMYGTYIVEPIKTWCHISLRPLIVQPILIWAHIYIYIYIYLSPHRLKPIWNWALIASSTYKCINLYIYMYMYEAMLKLIHNDWSKCIFQAPHVLQVFTLLVCP